MIKNLDCKKQVLLENYKDVEETTLADYIKCEADSDPGFFRWLFGDEDLEDFECKSEKDFEELISWAEAYQDEESED